MTTRQTRLSFNSRKRPQRSTQASKPTDLPTAAASKPTQPKHAAKKKKRLTAAQQQQLQQEKERREQRAAEREQVKAEAERRRRAEEVEQQRAINQHRRRIEQAFDSVQLDWVLMRMVHEGEGVSDSDDELDVDVEQPAQQPHAVDECGDQQMADGGREHESEEQPQPVSPTMPVLALPSPTCSSASSIGSEDSNSTAALSPVSDPQDSDDEPLSNRLHRSVSSVSSRYTSLTASSSSSIPRLCHPADAAAFELDFDLALDWPFIVQRDLYYKVAYTPLLPATPFALPAEYDDDRKAHCKDSEPNFTLIERNEWRRKKPAVKRNKQDRDDEEDSVTRCTCHLKHATDQPQLQQDEKAERRVGEEADGKVYNCGDGCLNATLLVECDDNNCALSSVQATDLCNKASDRCTNRAFTRHSSGGQTAPIEKCWYDVKGWGLRATADMEAGVFVIEYLGEVINNKECKKRIDKEDKRAERSRKRALQHDQHAKSKNKKVKTAAGQEENSEAGGDNGGEDDGAPRSNYYFMAVVDDVILDASSKGSIARFINHSCDANCVIQKWTVGDELRIGIFTQRKIRQGEELSIDYKYDRIGLHYQPCYCGSHNCAQWIGAKRTNGAVDGKQRVKLSKKDRKQADAAARARAEQNADEVCGGCGIGGDLVLCDAKLPTGHYCPRAHHAHCAELADLEGDILCAWHTCDRPQPGTQCKKRAQLYCVCCSSSRCRECHAVDEEWAMPWRESQLCQQRVMRLDVRDWLCTAVEGRDELWMVCRDCQQQPRVLMREELAIWKAITGQVEADDAGDGETSETDEKAEVVAEQAEGEREAEEEGREQAAAVGGRTAARCRGADAG